MSVASRFDTFLSNIALTDAQVKVGGERREAVVKALNGNYYNFSNSTANSLYIGSWGKRTRLRPTRDVDVLYTLPKAVYDRFQGRTGNKQSQLLQEIRGVLATVFANTNIRGDGPAVVVPFTAYNVELIPSFKLTDGKYWVCMTSNGGTYKIADYDAEASQISTSDTNSKGNTRHLVRMMKCWQGYCDVPIKSFWLELLAAQFLDTWKYRGESKTYYDWMVRDFLKHLTNQKNTWLVAPGTSDMMNIGEVWHSKANTALGRAEKACDYEGQNQSADAGTEWQKIFGTDIPKDA
jgi:hypothetical protein